LDISSHAPISLGQVTLCYSRTYISKTQAEHGPATAISTDVQARFIKSALKNRSGIEKTWRLIFVFILVFLSMPAVAQSNGKGSAEGTLSVTATLVASATLTFGPDGKQEIVIANAPDSRDNVSRLSPMKKLTNNGDQKSMKVGQKAGHHK
jgi:hypothetical protein